MGLDFLYLGRDEFCFCCTTTLMVCQFRRNDLVDCQFDLSQKVR